MTDEEISKYHAVRVSREWDSYTTTAQIREMMLAVGVVNDEWWWRSNRDTPYNEFLFKNEDCAIMFKLKYAK